VSVFMLPSRQATLGVSGQTGSCTVTRTDPRAVQRADISAAVGALGGLDPGLRCARRRARALGRADARRNSVTPRGIARYRRHMAMTLRLTEAEQEALRVTAEREHRSMQAVAAAAINQYTSGRARRVSEAIDRVLVEDADLLADLG
jgi:predicted transcriptional regulator